MFRVYLKYNILVIVAIYTKIIIIIEYNIILYIQYNILNGIISSFLTCQMSAARRYWYLVQSHGPILVGGGGGGLGGSGGRLLSVFVEAQLLGKVPGQPFYSDRIFGGLSVNREKNISDFKTNEQKNKPRAGNILGHHGTAVPAGEEVTIRFNNVIILSTGNNYKPFAYRYMSTFRNRNYMHLHIRGDC